MLEDEQEIPFFQPEFPDDSVPSEPETTDEPSETQITPDLVKKIRQELGVITLCWPEIHQPKFEDRTTFPEPYYTNNDKERLCLLYAENFRRQFSNLWPKRRPILLACENECGIQKMVCTTIRPTMLGYAELYEWDGCAKFIADHIKYEVLEKPTLLPPRLMSPATLMTVQHGNSFEMATLLASLLIGVGYNAYVCSGYATQDVTENLLIRSHFPDELEDPEVIEEERQEDLKYKLRPPNDLTSQFETRMVNQEKIRNAQEWAQEESKRLAALAELEKPPQDPLHGWRLHSWIVILPSARDIDKPFFIEPSTGTALPISHSEYLGLESIWNHENYWINLQKWGDGIEWDLINLEHWEHLLVGEPIKDRAKLGNMLKLDLKLVEKHLDMPASWSELIKLPFELFERRYPNGTKTIDYKKCKVELYSPYVQPDGLIKRATIYSDYEYSEPIKVYEFYENRKDRLRKLEIDLSEDQVVEKFSNGRLEDSVIEHQYYQNETSHESYRKIKYNADRRYNGLESLSMTPITLHENFVGRKDFLVSREVNFYPRGQPPPGVNEGRYRIVMQVVEKFDRNLEKEAWNDVRIREFAVDDNEIRLKYHCVKGKITFSTRTFIKPPISERGDLLRFDPEKTSGYLSEKNVKPPRQLELYRLLQFLLAEEDATMHHIRTVDENLESFLKKRDLELAVPQLTVSLYHPTRNTQFLEGMLAQERAQTEQRQREIDISVDYLAPYLIKLGNPDNLTLEQAKTVYETCLNDFKNNLLSRVLDIQRQFNEVDAELDKKQKWFDSIKDTLTRSEAEEYFAGLSGKIFLLHCLELRLDRHKELAPERFQAMDRLLKMDPKLSILFASETNSGSSSK